jgi:hypothetical protein
MNIRYSTLAVAILFLGWVGVIHAVSAHGLRQWDDRQQLVGVEQNGSHVVTESSQLGSDMMDTRSVQKAGQRSNDASGSVAASSDIGTSRARTARAPRGKKPDAGNADHCVGPIDFCDMYFGGS